MHQQTNEPIRQPDEYLVALDKSFEVFVKTASEFPRDRVRDKPSERAFSATEIVYHMLDVERLWQHRIRGMLDGTITHFQQMNPDAVAIEQRYNERPYEAGITELSEARKDTHTIIRAMKPRELEITAVHSKYGEMDTFKILDTIEDHDHTHAAQLRRTLDQLSQAKVTTAL